MKARYQQPRNNGLLSAGRNVDGRDVCKHPDTHPPIEPLRPPKGVPNVLVVLNDDAGSGASSAFGGVPAKRPRLKDTPKADQFLFPSAPLRSSSSSPKPLRFG